MSRSQSQTCKFQRPGGRGTFRRSEPSRLTSSIDPSLVRSSNKFNASRDPSGDQQTPADVPGSNLTGISRGRLPSMSATKSLECRTSPTVLIST